ncbi:TetR/AcrR family transcriptional regulator [Kineosporia sp. A_224]|uniref:TetR/AcrR family transcriptional regulator n=1 Tax=Kineosporia sp. A_224 TaxID=1962180 RepID=UPI0018E9F1C7|nr:TetR/AcrR family transcriptional regulator [Kineosporia sp. A_224]
MTSPAPDDSGSLEVRPPLQRRSREAWGRVLDAGVELLEEGGYEAFTIAAVCERAQVAPRALYARVDTKDALFLAVYEHGLERVRSDQAALTHEARWAGLSAEDVMDRAVREVAGIFRRHAAFLRPVVLISGAHAEVYRRGGAYSRELGDQFTTLLLRAGAAAGEPDPERSVRAAFNTIFSTLVVRTAYGPTFAVPAADDEDFVDSLAVMVRRYLAPR